MLSVIPDGLGHTVRSRVASVCRRYANFWRGASLSLRLIRGARDGCDRRNGALADAARASAQRRRRLSSHNRPLVTLTESPQMSNAIAAHKHRTMLHVLRDRVQRAQRDEKRGMPGAAERVAAHTAKRAAYRAANP